MAVRRDKNRSTVNFDVLEMTTGPRATYAFQLIVPEFAHLFDQVAHFTFRKYTLCVKLRTIFGSAAIVCKNLKGILQWPTERQ